MKKKPVYLNGMMIFLQLVKSYILSGLQNAYNNDFLMYTWKLYIDNRVFIKITKRVSEIAIYTTVTLGILILF